MSVRECRFGFVGGQNLFKEYPEQLGKSGEERFQLRGGESRLEVPEDPVATWAPDNVPVEVRVTPTGLIAREPIEPADVRATSPSRQTERTSKMVSQSSTATGTCSSFWMVRSMVRCNGTRTRSSMPAPLL